MKLDYRDYRSEIVEYFFIPLFIRKRDEILGSDFSQKEKEILKDALETTTEIENKLADFRQEAEEVYLWGYVFSLLHLLYFYLLDKGKDPQTVDEAYEEILSLSQAEVELVFRDMLAETNDGEREEEHTLQELLDHSIKKPEEKWYWSLALRNPLEAVQKAVALSRKLVPIYKPYLEQSKEEREEFAESLDIEKLYRESSKLAMTSLDDVSEKLAQLFVLSPWNFYFAYYGNDRLKNMGVTLLVSCRMDQLLLSKEEIDLDDAITALKVISDSTRYQVLLELIKPHAKSKDIADKLNITGAAVSFHAQKLINGGLLLFNTQDSDRKYVVNQDLLRQIIAKLTDDFHL
ncbi:winged helix-turn-helix transcriptional regulator [Streptococcus suis]|nr:winged helix-turn-helix transcriptional regulator [Streptococcus suis]